MKRLTIVLITAIYLVTLFGCQNNENLNTDIVGTTESAPLSSPDGSQSSVPDETAEGSTTEGELITESTLLITTTPVTTTKPVTTKPITTTKPVTTTKPAPTPPPEPSKTDLVLISDYLDTVKISLVLSTENNFTGKKIYDFSDAYLRYGTVKKLAKVADDLKSKGYGLVIWDAFRPVSAQAKLWEAYPDPLVVSDPLKGDRPFCRGNTLSVTLYDLKTKEVIQMPTGHGDITNFADRDYTDCPDDAGSNALLLEDVMKKQGFVPYAYAWWQFSDSDTYNVEEYFTPVFPSVWIVTYDGGLNLRKTPGGTIITKLKKNAQITLLGWNGKFAKVSYNGKVGYVSSNYIKPKGTSIFSSGLQTVKMTNVYKYEQMLSDIAALKARFPDKLTVDSIGKSELGRDLPVLIIGDLNAENHVLIQGAIHGREHITSWLLMAMTEYWLDHGITGYGSICYHIIPMLNPDGVTISQTKTLGSTQKTIYKSDKSKGYTINSSAVYASRWKANALGVDLNSNFPSGWNEVEGHAAPSSENYKGTAPFSAAEAAALRDYTLKYSFDATVSYHSTGSLIYYEYGNKQPVNNQSLSLAGAVNKVTGYTIEGNTTDSGAGYKDWAMNELGIPSLTIEVGVDGAPLDIRETYSLFARNYNVLPAIAKWLQK